MPIVSKSGRLSNRGRASQRGIRKSSAGRFSRGQDYRALGQHVDVFSPMVYHWMCGCPPAWIGAVVQEVHELSGKPVWPIIQFVTISLLIFCILCDML